MATGATSSNGASHDPGADEVEEAEGRAEVALAPPTEGTQRRSRFRGVSWHKSRNKWQAQIRGMDGKKKCLGYFIDEAAAAEAYGSYALAHGLPRHLNFSDSPHLSTTSSATEPGNSSQSHVLLGLTVLWSHACAGPLPPPACPPN